MALSCDAKLAEVSFSGLIFAPLERRSAHRPQCEVSSFPELHLLDPPLTLLIRSEAAVLTEINTDGCEVSSRTLTCAGMSGKSS